MSPLLEITGLNVARSGFEIVNNVDLVAPAGEVTVLLGSNGAGKTTLLEAVSGVIPCAAGSVSLEGEYITSMRRGKRARRGLAHVEQGRTVFPELTTEENLLVAAPKTALGPAFDLFPSLEKRRHVKSGLLSGGEQQMLVLARAIVGSPKMLLLDEISLGLAPVIIQDLMPVVRRLADSGIGVLLVEQFAELALDIGDSALVLSRGKVVFNGSCEKLRSSPELLQGAYLAGADPEDEPAQTGGS